MKNLIIEFKIFAKDPKGEAKEKLTLDYPCVNTSKIAPLLFANHSISFLSLNILSQNQIRPELSQSCCFWCRSTLGGEEGGSTTLLIVSIAFLAFFCEQALELVPLNVLHSESVYSIMDFVILALFFFALASNKAKKKEK